MTRASTRRRSWFSAAFLPVAAACMFALGACSTTQAEQQSTQSVPQTDAAQSMPMSGEYPILQNGKLGRPLDWVEPTEPELPSAATNMNASGAEHFARYYLDLLAYAINTGNITTLKKVSSEECTLCKTLIDNINSLYDGHEWATGIKYTVQSADDPMTHPVEHERYLVTMDVMTSPYIEYRNDEITPFDENPLYMEFEVKQEESSFRMNGFYAENRVEDKESQS